MTSLRLPHCVLSLSLLVGCGGGNATDAGVDANGDQGRIDAAVESGPDAASDSGADVALDVVTDATADAHTDAAIGADAHADAATSLAVGTIVPLYTFPTDASWTRVAAAARAHPGVHLVAAINPNSGPTPTADLAYAAGIVSLQAAGVVVIGYVSTRYGGRLPTDVNADVDLYRSEYPTLDGIFFDEAAIYETGHEAVYSAEAMHARTQGYGFLVANAGTAPISAYASFFDVALVYESAGAPTRASLDAFASIRTHCGIIPYAVATLDNAYVVSIRPDVEWVYLTNDDLPNPWDTLPSYFDALLSALESP